MSELLSEGSSPRRLHLVLKHTSRDSAFSQRREDVDFNDDARLFGHDPNAWLSITFQSSAIVIESTRFL